MEWWTERLPHLQTYNVRRFNLIWASSDSNKYPDCSYSLIASVSLLILGTSGTWQVSRVLISGSRVARFLIVFCSILVSLHSIFVLPLSFPFLLRFQLLILPGIVCRITVKYLMIIQKYEKIYNMKNSENWNINLTQAFWWTDLHLWPWKLPSLQWNCCRWMTEGVLENRA